MNFRRSVIIAGLWRFCDKCFSVFGKTTLYSKIFKIVSKVFIASPIYVVVFKFREFWPTGNLRNRALFRSTGKRKKDFICLSKTVASALIAPKICQGQPPTMYSECSRFHSNRFTFGGVIAQRCNCVRNVISIIKSDR